MKKKIKLPTILGVLILISGLIAGVVLINLKQIFKLGATSDFAPKNVRISNIKENSLTITWTTDIKSTGFVKWGKSGTSLSKVTLEENAEKEFIHSVSLSAIDPNTNVFFKINSEGKDFDNSGIPWQSTSLQKKMDESSLLTGSGMILSLDGSTPAKAIVYLSINGRLLSSTTSLEGTWIIPISLFMEQVQETTVIEISVIDGQGGTASATIYPKSIKTTPTIIIGKTYDFKNYVPSIDPNLPESQLIIPESVEASSRFEVDNSEPSLSTDTITLDSIDEGEIITTTNPEFFGTSPKMTEIEISVESELQTDSLTSSSTGKWSWSPANDLEPGEHTVTIKWRDVNGILRTLTRKFVVQAGEAPAFEATPSATLNQTVAPTNSPISTATPSTLPLPETGNLTPTIGLFIMGIGVLMSSVFVWKKANA